VNEELGIHELVLRMGKGDKHALETLYELLHPQLKQSLLHRFCPPLREEDIQDVIQRTFMQIWINAAHYRGKYAGASARKWVYTIATNEAYRMVRAARAAPPSLDPCDGDDDSPEQRGQPEPDSRYIAEDEAMDSLLIEQIRRYCLQFPPREKEMLLLRFQREFTFEQIGARFGLTRARVKQIIDGLIGKLRKRLGV
jgi:RNA polymerase sigma factor (sigma-70 family)